MATRTKREASTFGKIIKRIRAQRSLALREIAEASGVSIATICHVENGVSDGSPTTRRAIARGLGFNIVDLMAIVAAADADN